MLVIVRSKPEEDVLLTCKRKGIKGPAVVGADVQCKNSANCYNNTGS